MTDLFGYRWRPPESAGSGFPETGSGLDELRAQGEVMLNASSRAIANVMDPERFLSQARQRSGQ